MKLFITGATGLIGRRLVIDRLERGDQVVLLSRDAARAGVMFAATANRNITVVQGDPVKAALWQRAVDGCDAVIHLAGAGIADRRWSAAYKKQIIDSRMLGTQNVVNAMQQAKARPGVFISGSAVGYYGDTGETLTDEGAPAGRDFLAKICVDWEAQSMRAMELNVRTVLLRTGMVLDDRGGALTMMLTPFRMFVGGPIGSGRQYMPWIHWRDLIGIIDLALGNEAINGAVNGTGPEPVTNREFSSVLGAAINRPSWLPVPKFAVRVVMGEVANYITLSQRVIPAKAQQGGYQFHFSTAEAALQALLGSMTGEPDGGTDRRRGEQIDVAWAGAVDVLSDRHRMEGKQSMPAEPIKLLAISVDGALLRSDGTIARGVVQACRNAQRSGCVVVVATARPPRGVAAVLQALDIVGPAITSNGALIWNPQEHKAQYHEPLPPELARNIVEDARAIDAELVVGVEALDRWYVDPVDPRTDPRFQDRAMGLFEPDGVGSIDAHLSQPVTRLSLIGDPASIERVLDMLREKYWRPRKVSIPLSNSHLIQIAHPLADKSIALQRIAHHMNLKPEQVMAIGDGPNDLGMLEWAGFSVAMGNATLAARDLADAVVPSNDEQGVARAIGRFVLAKR